MQNPAAPSSSDPAGSSTPFEVEPPLRSLRQKIAFGILLFFAVGLMSLHIWCEWKMSVSIDDIRHTTWLGSSAPDPWVASVLNVGVAVGAMLFGAAIGVAKNSPIPALVGIIFAAVISLSLGESQFLLAEMTGNARIGCFDWSTRECRQMLGVPEGNAPSVLIPSASEDFVVVAPWFEQRERQLMAQRQSQRIPDLARYAHETFSLDERSA